MEKKYLFKRAADGKWIFGQTVKSVCKAGLYRIDPLSVGENFVIYAIYNRDISIKYTDTFSNYKKENGEAYASIEEFLATTVDFFDPGTASGGPITVTGALTNAELRATPVPVFIASGVELEFKNDSGNPLPISGPVTDAQLRASAVPVSGPLTDVQLRAAPLPSSKVAAVEVRLTRPADVIQYAANDAINSSVGAPVSLNLPDMAMANGRGGYLMQINAASDMVNLADATVRLWFYRTEPVGIVGDNVAMTNSTANITNGRHYIDVKFNSLLAGSSSVIGQNSPVWNYVCDVASKDLKLRVQTLTAFTPTAGGFIDFTFTVTQL